MMRKSITIVCILSVCLLCGCSNTNVNVSSVSQQIGSETVTDASAVNETISNNVIPVANDSWELQFVYAGHIQSSFDYPIENVGGGMLGEDSVFVSSEHKDYSLINGFQIFPSGTENDKNMLEYKSGKSVYTLNTDGYFSYRNNYHESETDYGGHTQFQDSYNITLDKEKVAEYYLRALKILNVNEGVSLLDENIYEPYHSNPDGIMITEYKPYNLMCKDKKGYCNNIVIEIDEQKYQKLLSLFEEIRQLTDKYNWEKLENSKKQSAAESNDNAGYIPIPNLP